MWMRAQTPVPTIYVLPEPFFRGTTNFGDVEFPIYWYSFVKGWLKEGKKITLVSSSEQIERIRIILQETIFGPPRMEMEKEGASEEEIQRIEKESYYFTVKDAKGKPYPLEAFVQFVAFNEGGVAVLNEQVSIERRNGDAFIINDKESKVPLQFQVSAPIIRGDVHYPPESTKRAYFGRTHIGTSSGFDPNGFTTSLIVWMNYLGVIVDPLAYIDLHLKALGITSRDVPDVLLTHVHGDHDPGLIAYILLGQKVRLWTTRTIYESFLRKSKAITGQDFKDLVHFCELKANVKQHFRDGFYVTARNNFHSIPTIGILIESPSGTSFFYSGDTYYDPLKYEELVKDNVLTAERVRELSIFGFSAKFVLHEAGIPPLHTPVPPLEKTSKLKERAVVLVHRSQPKDNDPLDLSVARSGESFEFESLPAQNIVDERSGTVKSALRGVHVTFLSSISANMIKKYEKNTEIITQGKPVERKMYVILEGEVSVIKDNKVVARLERGDYFGEQSALLHISRTATVRSESNVTLLEIEGDALDQAIREVPSLNPRSAELFQSMSFPTPSFFEKFKTEVIRNVFVEFASVTFKENEIIINNGEEGNALYLIERGAVRVEGVGHAGQSQVILKKGEIFGEMALLGDKNTPRNATVRAYSEEGVTCQKLDREAFRTFIEQYPLFLFLLRQLANRRSLI